MKKFLMVLISILGLAIVGCNENKVVDNVKIFNAQIAQEKAKQYVYRIQTGDMAGANDISTKELASKAKIEGNMLPIVDFMEEKVTEVNNGAYVEINVVRSSKRIPKCNIDKWIIKVEKNQDGDYLVADVKSGLLKDAIAKKDILYLIDAGDAQREVVTKLNDIPGVLYPENESVMINKNSIPKERFQTLGMNFNGDKIAFSTTKDNDCFIGVALLDSVKAVFAMGREVAQEVEPKDLKEIFEKPIAQKIIYCDIIKNSRVNRFIFTEEGNALIVEFTGENNSAGLNVYTLPDGALVPLNLDKMFPLEKYELKYLGSIKSNILIKVEKKTGVNGINQELLGEYIINLRTNSVDKV